MLKKEIYRIGGNLGLDKNDIDIILTTQHHISYIKPISNVYKSGTEYGTISPTEIYKGGTRYGTVSFNEIYKTGTLYGVISTSEV
jgi:hypothetical protein